MHPETKAPQEQTVKPRTKGLVETFDIPDRSDGEEDEGEANNKPSSSISLSLKLKVWHKD